MAVAADQHDALLTLPGRRPVGRVPDLPFQGRLLALRQKVSKWRSYFRHAW